MKTTKYPIHYNVTDLLFDTFHVCKHWQRFKGYCMFGEKCKFLHPAELNEQNIHNSNTEGGFISVAEQRRQVFPR